MKRFLIQLRRVLRWLRWFVLVMIVTLAVLIYTPLGMPLVAPITAWLTDDLVQIDNASGTLAGPFSAKQVSIRNESMHLRFQQVQAEWNLYAWLKGELDVGQLRVERFDLAVQGDGGEPENPSQFLLPFPMRAQTIQLGELVWHAQLNLDGEQTPLFHDLRASLDSDGRHHQLNAAGQRQRLHVDTSLKLDGAAPMPISGSVNGRFAVDNRQLHWALQADGELPRFRLFGEVSGEGARGHVDAQLTLFQRYWLEQLQLNTEGIDLSLMFAGAPKTELIIQADTKLADVNEITGTLAVSNLKAGLLDSGRIPVDSITAVLHADPERLALTQLVIQRGDGRLDGRAELTAEGLQLDTEIHQLLLSALHPALPARRVNGQLDSTIVGNEQRFELTLVKGKDRLNAQIVNDSEAIEVSSFTIDGLSGKATGSATLQWNDNRDFVFDARTDNLGLHEWLNLDQSKIKLQLSGQGQLQPALQLQAQYDIAPSTFEGRPLSGKGSINWLPAQHIATDSFLKIGNNQLSAKGEFGHANARLHLDIDAPDLRLPFLKGALQGKGWIGGTVSKPQAELALQTKELIAGSLLHFINLDWRTDFRLDGEAPTVIDIRAERFFIEGIVDLQKLNLHADGTTSSHQLRVEATNPKGQWLLALQGGFKEQTWQGTLQQLRLHALETLALQQPTSLQFSTDSFNLGQAEFQLGAGRLQLDHLRYGKTGWSSEGHIEQWPIVDWLPIAYGESDLTLNGEWQIDWQQRPNGFFRMQRHAGDIRWRNGSQQVLGIETLQAEAQFGKEQVEIQGSMQGKKLGILQWQGQAPSKPLFENFREAPLQASVRISIPDLAWIGPFFSPSFVTGGELKGEIELRGSMESPTWRGFIEGNQLAFASIGTGLRLKDGNLQVEVDNNAVRLREFSFVDDGRQKPPRKELADIGSGGISGSGEFQWRQQTGNLMLKFDRLGVMQLPDQWIRLSGNTEARYENGATTLTGDLKADGGYLKLATRGRPALSDDVIVEGQERGGATPISIQMTANLGEQFYFSGSGIDARLQGELRLVAVPGNPLKAYGTISTVDGKFDGYGQRLSIERGRLNFQGLVDNPGLDVRAMRRSQNVAAGVEITGTVLNPEVRLVSEPNMPDAEKLSWLVLGKGLSDVKAGDPGLLIAAGSALFGDQGGGTLQDIQSQLGVNFSFRTGSLAQQYGGPRSRVIEDSGFNGGGAEQIVSVSKELISGVRIGFEQVVDSNESIVTLSWALTDALTLETRSGAENAIDLFYTIIIGQ